MKRLAALISAFGALVATIAFAIFAVPAAGLEPAPPAKAQLIYTNGGRLVQIAADGSGRTVLTYKNYLMPGGYGDSMGDHRVQVSPDGSRLLFTRYLDDSGNMPEPFFMISNRDGTEPRRILGNRENVKYGNPAWMPDGSIVATREVTKKRKVERSVVGASANGGDVRTVLNLKPHLLGNMKRDLSTDFEPIGLSASPDGSRLLISMRDGNKDDHRWLELADLATGQRRNIAPGGSSADFSPDGSKIVFASNHGEKRKYCGGGVCIRPTDLFVADGEGGRPVRLTRTRGFEDSPAWSPDGSRIAFSSTRIFPRLAAAAEIYSIAPDGSCMTWLTNGSPASIEPTWDGVAGDTGAGGCGATPRRPLAETKPLPSTSIPKRPRLWAGSNSGGRLFSGNFEFLGIELLEYLDCSSYDAADCAPPAAIFSLSTCMAAGSMASTIGEMRGIKPRTRRGVLTMIDRSGKWPVLLAFSGGAVNYVMATSGKKGPGAARAASRSALGFFSNLRPIGSETLAKRLPAFRVPVRDLREMKKVRSAYRRTGSVLKTAKRLRIRRSQVRDNLFMAKTLGRYGRIKAVKCPDINKILGFSRDDAGDPPVEIQNKADELGIRIPR